MHYSILVVGAANSGKKSLVNAIGEIYGYIPIASSIVTFIHTNSTSVTISKYDKNIKSSFNAIILLYDISDYNSFLFIKSFAFAIPVVLVGTKVDLLSSTKRMVQIEEARYFAHLSGFEFREISIKAPRIIQSLVDLLMDKMQFHNSKEFIDFDKYLLENSTSNYYSNHENPLVNRKTVTFADEKNLQNSMPRSHVHSKIGIFDYLNKYQPRDSLSPDLSADCKDGEFLFVKRLLNEFVITKSDSDTKTSTSTRANTNVSSDQPDKVEEAANESAVNIGSLENDKTQSSMTEFDALMNEFKSQFGFKEWDYRSSTNGSQPSDVGKISDNINKYDHSNSAAKNAHKATEARVGDSPFNFVDSAFSEYHLKQYVQDYNSMKKKVHSNVFTMCDYINVCENSDFTEGKKPELLQAEYHSIIEETRKSEHNNTSEKDYTRASSESLREIQVLKGILKGMKEDDVVDLVRRYGKR